MRERVPDDRQQRAAATDEALRRAQFAIRDQRPLEAERLATDILKANAGHREAAKVLGYALMLQGRAKEAIAPLEKLARSSRDPESETQLAIALRQIGRIDEALIWLNRAVKRKPPFAGAFHELGLELKLLRRHEEAIAAFKQGIAVAPMMIDMVLQLGYAYYANNDRANARNVFTQAYSMNPGYSPAVHALCAVLMDEHEFAQAAELFRNAFAANPDDTAARIGLGYCLLNLGDTEAAFACLRAATARGPQFYGRSLKAAVTSAHGRFWLRPSAAAKFLKGEKA